LRSRGSQVQILPGAPCSATISGIGRATSSTTSSCHASDYRASVSFYETALGGPQRAETQRRGERYKRVASGENARVADIPDLLILKRHRDLEGMRNTLWWRRGVLVLLSAFLVLGLANVFGQRPSTAVASADAADLKLYAPTHLRGGLLFSARFHISAHRELKKATLVLDPGWLEGMAVNTIEPSPVGEASTNGRVSFDLGHIPAGQSFILWMQFQVNPTNIAWHRSQNVELDDGQTKILTIHRSVIVFP
jgi:hypothetical protein